MGDSVGLRWWEEEKQSAAKITQPLADSAPVRTEAAAATVETEAVLDIGEELEAEARRRAEMQSIEERDTIVFETTAAQRVAKLRRRFTRHGLPFVLSLAAFISLFIALTVGRVAPPYIWLPMILVMTAFYTLELFVIYLALASRYRKPCEPAITLSPAGITVRAPMMQIGLIRWDEIETVRVCNLLPIGGARVGIVPKNAKALAARLPHGTCRMMSLNAACLRFSPRWLRERDAPILVLDELLPLSAREMVDRIEAYRAVYADPSASKTPAAGGERAWWA